MGADVPTAEPRRADFASAADFVEAYDAFHDGRPPTDADTLDRAVRLASESMRGIDLQIRRLRGAEPEDGEWLFRVWMDFSFLIACLWRVRMAGRMAATATATDDVRTAVDVFDHEIPDLARMRASMVPGGAKSCPAAGWSVGACSKSEGGAKIDSTGSAAQSI